MAEDGAKGQKNGDQLTEAQSRVISFFVLLSQICPDGSDDQAVSGTPALLNEPDSETPVS